MINEGRSFGRANREWAPLCLQLYHGSSWDLLEVAEI